ncbi:hypothetical protein KW787_00805 [Candidatus Pacearchaeota archaeon]|nr:hypothetical protein [Candidatus Pacearchaeota archaeon]
MPVRLREIHLTRSFPDNSVVFFGTVGREGASPGHVALLLDYDSLPEDCHFIMNKERVWSTPASFEIPTMKDVRMDFSLEREVAKVTLVRSLIRENDISSLEVYDNHNNFLAEVWPRRWWTTGLLSKAAISYGVMRAQRYAIDGKKSYKSLRRKINDVTLQLRDGMRITQSCYEDMEKKLQGLYKHVFKELQKPS